jgi:hypothetical protein
MLAGIHIDKIDTCKGARVEARLKVGDGHLVKVWESRCICSRCRERENRLEDERYSEEGPKEHYCRT